MTIHLFLRTPLAREGHILHEQFLQTTLIAIVVATTGREERSQEKRSQEKRSKERRSKERRSKE
jgi:hypothetical protein